MQIDIITAFPSIVNEPLQHSIVKKAQQKNIVTINVHDLRKWTQDRHKTIDDAPYGGGAGMIFKVEPLYDCLVDVTKNTNHDNQVIVLTSPGGEKYSQKKATQLSLIENVIIICGHYKGIDERIKSFFPIEEISIGDYVLTGGEIPALVMVDSIIRLIPGAIKDVNSAWSDSFSDSLLDCDYYTRPETFKGVSVPEILLSGDHEKIKNWRHEQRIDKTKKSRPDLYKKHLNEID